MRYAVISDIHSNREALSRALDLIDGMQVDEIVCLGDIVGYGADPNECVRLVRERCSLSVLGNHDAAALDPSVAHDFNVVARRAVEWTAAALSPDHADFLRTLPMTAVKDGLRFVHSSPQWPESWEYIMDHHDAGQAFGGFTESICFIGHTHVPGIFTQTGRAKRVTRDERYIINVGSIGQPRDGNPKLSFGIFDTDAWNYEQVRSEYDIQSAAARIYAAGLPEELGNRLMFGM